MPKTPPKPPSLSPSCILQSPSCNLHDHSILATVPIPVLSPVTDPWYCSSSGDDVRSLYLRSRCHLSLVTMCRGVTPITGPLVRIHSAICLSPMFVLRTLSAHSATPICIVSLVFACSRCLLSSITNLSGTDANGICGTAIGAVFRNQTIVSETPPARHTPCQSLLSPPGRMQISLRFTHVLCVVLA